MDKYADNYSSVAQKDDGSCKYSKGSLVVYAKDGANQALSGEEIWIYNSQSSYNNANPYKQIVADSQGKAVFTDLPAGHYWADCAFTTTGGGTAVAEGEGDVSLGMETTITIVP